MLIEEEDEANTRLDLTGASIRELDSAQRSSGEHADGAPSIELPNQEAHYVSHIALDIGGSLIKLVYFSPDPYHDPTALGSVSSSESAESTSQRASSSNGSRGGRLHFVKFETSRVEDAIAFIEAKGLHRFHGRGGQKEMRVKATGGGAYKYAELFKTRLGVVLEKEDEMSCLVAGCNFLLKAITHEAFTYENSTSHFVPTNEEGDLYPYLLVNIGSGVSMVRVTAEGVYERVSGSSLGGGTFWGLCHLLTGRTNFDDMLELSMQGDNSQVDMLVGDIYGGRDYTNIGLSANTIASSFGKVIGQDLPLSEYKPENICMALCRMVSYNIGQLAYLNAMRYNIKRIFFGGFFIRGHPYTMETISYAIRFWSKGDMAAMFLRHEGFLGSVGAFLLVQPNILSTATSSHLNAKQPGKVRARFVERFSMGAPFAGGEVVGPAWGDLSEKVSWVEKFVALGGGLPTGETGSGPGSITRPSTHSSCGQGEGKEEEGSSNDAPSSDQHPTSGQPQVGMEVGKRGRASGMYTSGIPSQDSPEVAGPSGEGGGVAVGKDETNTETEHRQASDTQEQGLEGEEVSNTGRGSEGVEDSTSGTGGADLHQQSDVIQGPSRKGSEPASGSAPPLTSTSQASREGAAAAIGGEGGGGTAGGRAGQGSGSGVIGGPTPPSNATGTAAPKSAVGGPGGGGGGGGAGGAGGGVGLVQRTLTSDQPLSPAVRMALHVGVLHYSPCYDVFPLLADPTTYEPNTLAVWREEEELQWWLGVLENALPTVMEKAACSEGSTEDARRRAAAFGRAFGAHCAKLRAEPGAYGALGLSELFEMREECLREFAFTDPYRADKLRENTAALCVLPDLLAELDSMEHLPSRWLALVEGALAANIFDWGAVACVDLYKAGTILDIYRKARGQLANRPWALDEFDSFAERLARGPPYRRTLMFVDNAGADIVLGQIPIARELLRSGCEVVLVANKLPAINDITAVELERLLDSASSHCPVLCAARRKGLTQQSALGGHVPPLRAPSTSSTSPSSSSPQNGTELPALYVLSNGQGSPCIDFRRVPDALVEACAGTDLIIIDGMGRAIHTNLRAKFKCESLLLAMIKTERLAKRLFGSSGALYDCVCKYTPGLATH